MKLFLILVFIPLVSYADGIMYNDYTLEIVKMALMAKVILYDSKKSIAKVEVKKIFAKIQSSKNNSVVQGDSFQDAETLKTTLWSQIKPGDILSVRIEKKPEFEPRHWISVDRYWNESPTMAENETYLLVSRGFDFVASPYSKFNEEKFELLFDQDKFLKKLKEFSVVELEKLVLDQDYDQSVLAELIKRKAITTDFFIKLVDLSAFNRLVTLYVNKLDKNKKYDFWFDLSKKLKNSPIEIQTQYLDLFNNNSQEFTVKQKVAVLFNFPLKEVDIRYKVSTLFYEIRRLIDSKDYSALLLTSDLFLEFIKNNHADVGSVTMADYLNHLPEKDKNLFLEKMVEPAIEYLKTNSSLNIYYKIIEALETTKNLKVAWQLTQVNFAKLNSGEKDKLFNSVLAVLFFKENLEKKETREKILNWTKHYLAEAEYPIELTPLNKTKYSEIGGFIYKELDNLRLDHQTNSEELARKFKYYFERALVIEVIEINKKINLNTVKIKILDLLGELSSEDPKSSYKDALAINKKARKNEILFLAIDNQSLELLEKLKLKSMILATKSNDYKFLIFDMSYKNTITEAFLK